MVKGRRVGGWVVGGSVREDGWVGGRVGGRGRGRRVGGWVGRLGGKGKTGGRVGEVASLAGCVARWMRHPCRPLDASSSQSVAPLDVPSRWMRLLHGVQRTAAPASGHRSGVCLRGCGSTPWFAAGSPPTSGAACQGRRPMQRSTPSAGCVRAPHDHGSAHKHGLRGRVGRDGPQREDDLGGGEVDVEVDRRLLLQLGLQAGARCGRERRHALACEALCEVGRPRATSLVVRLDRGRAPHGRGASAKTDRKKVDRVGGRRLEELGDARQKGRHHNHADGVDGQADAHVHGRVERLLIEIQLEQRLVGRRRGSPGSRSRNATRMRLTVKSDGRRAGRECAMHAHDRGERRLRRVVVLQAHLAEHERERHRGRAHDHVGLQAGHRQVEKRRHRLAGALAHSQRQLVQARIDLEALVL